MDDLMTLVVRCMTLLIMIGFLPVCAFTYYAYRVDQRKLEIKRILRILKIRSDYRNIYLQDFGKTHFLVSVLFTMSIATAGLAALLLSRELGLTDAPNLLLAGTRLSKPGCGAESVCLTSYQQGAALAFGLGFLGAYIWGLQGILRRYSMNDLLPIAFYHFGLRLILSSFIALIIYHAVGGFSTEFDTSGQDSQMLTPTTDGILIVTVFLVGMFPQRGLRWLTGKIGLSESDNHPTVSKLPLDMIQGITVYDKFRLEELGIDTCYDLSTADFIPLLLKTSYGSRELIDWLLQAKLCVQFGEATQDLRKRGIRTITDLEPLDELELEALARETSLTLPSLRQATQNPVSKQDIDRLKRAAELLGHFWEGDDEENDDS